MRGNACNAGSTGIPVHAINSVGLRRVPHRAFGPVRDDIQFCNHRQLYNHRPSCGFVGWLLL